MIVKTDAPGKTLSEVGHVRPARTVVARPVFERAADLFHALGDPARLRVLELLLHGELCVSEIADEMVEEMSTVSQRLRLLRNLGLVSRRRSGRHIIYSLGDGHVAELVRSGLTHAGEASSSA